MKLKPGDVLIADAYCGFPDHTTKGKEYVVQKTNAIGFYILNDKGQETIPISTTFVLKNTSKGG